MKKPSLCVGDGLKSSLVGIGGFAGRLVPAFLLALSLEHAGAQILHSSGQAPTFEVATIKPSPLGPARALSLGPQGDGRFVAKNSTVKALIEFAYTTDSDNQIIGLPGWTKSERYDINAQVEDAQVVAMSKLPLVRKFDQYRLMQQSLLVERFHLKVHFETRGMPAYALVVAKKGPKLTPTKMNPSNPSETLKRQSLAMLGSTVAAGAGTTTGMLAEFLQRQPELGGGSGRTVVDKTNLLGLYDWKLHRTPWSEPSAGEPPDSSGPPLVTALQEQLGLKLEPTKATVEVIVVDYVEHPLPN